MRIAITGANGNIGKRLIRELVEQGEKDIVALVRSERSGQMITDDDLDVDIHIVNYDDADGIREAVGNRPFLNNQQNLVQSLINKLLTIRRVIVYKTSIPSM